MPRTRCLSLICLICVFVMSAEWAAGQAGGRPADAAAIDSAIDNAVRYLQSVQSPSGGWGSGTGPGSGKGWLVGYTSLVGLALVEAGVPTSDPGLKQALARVRSHVAELDSTYEVSLAILFLDRMGDKKDRRAIQILAGRLIAGQTANGGWGYKVPKLAVADHEALMTALRKLNPPLPPPPPSFRDRPVTMHLCIKSSDPPLIRDPGPAPDPVTTQASVLKTLPQSMRRWPVFLEPAELTWTEPNPPTSDNSNTHFAIVALWAARRHEVPVDRSLTLVARRFRTSQGSDGSWGYRYQRGGGGGSKAMTCVALLALAIGHVVDPEPNVKPESDPRIIKGFTWLSKHIGAPVGRTDGRPSPKEVGGLYYMWAMERIAVLYDVGRLDKKDWYQWGAEILLGHQKIDGSWSDEGGYHGQHPILNTSLALLFLTRANLTPDLSRRLVVDQTTLTARVDQSAQPKPEPPPTTKPTGTKLDPDPAVLTGSAPKAEPATAPKPSPKPTTSLPPAQPSAPLTQVDGTLPTNPGASDSSGKPAWLWGVLVFLVLLLLVIVALIVRRSMGAAATDDDDDDEEEKPVKNKRAKSATRSKR